MFSVWDRYFWTRCSVCVNCRCCSVGVWPTSKNPGRRLRGNLGQMRKFWGKFLVNIEQYVGQYREEFFPLEIKKKDLSIILLNTVVY